MREMQPQRIQTIVELRAALAVKRESCSIGFVPTMGFLHQGHGSLLARARAENDFVVLSIFVNPLQFNDDADYAVYPRNDTQDDQLAADAGCDIIFNPAVEEMYPAGSPLTTIKMPEIAEVFEGAYRPGHFEGVSIVVAKLLNIVGPDRAYFGEKDFQQLAVIRRLVLDLSMNHEIVGCPIVRDPDGLALSSRNSLLSAADRKKALLLNAALAAGEFEFSQGEKQPAALEDAMKAVLESAGDIDVDYAVAVDCETLMPLPRLTIPFQLLIAAKIGTTRLIDNRRVDHL